MTHYIDKFLEYKLLDEAKCPRGESPGDFDIIHVFLIELVNFYRHFNTHKNVFRSGRGVCMCFQRGWCVTTPARYDAALLAMTANRLLTLSHEDNPDNKSEIDKILELGERFPALQSPSNALSGIEIFLEARIDEFFKNTKMKVSWSVISTVRQHILALLHGFMGSITVSTSFTEGFGIAVSFVFKKSSVAYFNNYVIDD